jgi:hypothetical protein
MMNAVLQRPMFAVPVRRQTGTPEGGETTSSTRVMQGPIDSFKFDILDRLGVISNRTFNFDAPDKDFQINIDDAMSNPQLLNSVFDMIISSTGFDLDAFANMGLSQQQEYLNSIKGKLIFGKAEGGEIKSDAVGIADGLDQEEKTVNRDPSKEGIAKVSPEQYVQLMNEVRGDKVPLEGRVQELAMTVGERDAQDTPLSVLALVQPVFEMREQQGIAQTQQAQQMMQQPPMTMKDGGIVHLSTGTGGEGVYSGMVGPFSLDQIKNFGLYTKPEMTELGIASYATGAGDVIQSGSPEVILSELSGMIKEPKTFAEILQEKRDTIGGLGLFDSQRGALKVPLLAGLTQFGLDVAKGENVIDSALNRFNQATSVALPAAIQLKQQENQLPLQLALSEFSSQKDDIQEMKKFVLGKSFDLAIEREKKSGIGTVGVVGTDNDKINETFGTNVTDSLPVGTIVQQNTSGMLTTIEPDQFDVKNLVTITGSYVDNEGKTINVSTIVDVSTEEGLAEFNKLKGFSTKEASQLIFSPFIDTQPEIKLNTEVIMPGAKDGGLVEATRRLREKEIVKRSTGTDSGGEQSLDEKYPDIMSDIDFSDLEINPFEMGPGKIDVTKFDGSNRIIGLRYNTGDETLRAIEDLVLRTYTQPETVGILSSALRGYANLSNTVDELLTQLMGFGLPEQLVYNNPELQKTLEDMMRIPKLIAETEAGASRYRATPTDIDKISKERLDYGVFSSASSIRKSLIAVHKSIFDKMNTYRTSLGLPELEYKMPQVFDETYGASLEPREPIKLPSKDDLTFQNLQNILLDAIPKADIQKYPQLLTDPIFTNAIYSLSQGASMDQVGPKFLELFNEKYGTGE